MGLVTNKKSIAKTSLKHRPLVICESSLISRGEPFGVPDSDIKPAL